MPVYENEIEFPPFLVEPETVNDYDNPITEYQEYKYPLPDGKMGEDKIIGYHKKEVLQLFVHSEHVDSYDDLDELVEALEHMGRQLYKLVAKLRGW